MQQEVLEYIRKCQAMGMSDQAISSGLKNAGWNETAISQAWAEMKKPNAQTIPNELSLWGKYKKIILGAAILLLLLGGGRLEQLLHKGQIALPRAELLGVIGEALFRVRE